MEDKIVIQNLILKEKFKKTEGLVYRKEPNGIGIVLNRERGTIDYLNPTAAVIFELCDGKREIKEIVENLFDRFKIGINKEEVIDDTIKCIRKMEGRRLLRRCRVEF